MANRIVNHNHAKEIMVNKCHSNPQFPANEPNLAAATADFGNITRKDDTREFRRIRSLQIRLNFCIHLASVCKLTFPCLYLKPTASDHQTPTESR